jgi:hypothetical protein
VDVTDERHVHLEVVRADLGDRLQPGVARAHVVHGQTEAQPAAALQRLADLGEVVDGGMLGDLEDHLSRSQAGLAQLLDELRSGKLGIAKRLGLDVQKEELATVDAGEALQRALTAEPLYLPEQPVLLCRAEEKLGRREVTGRHARQGLVPENAPVPQVDDGLKDRAQPTPAQHALQVDRVATGLRPLLTHGVRQRRIDRAEENAPAVDRRLVASQGSADVDTETLHGRTRHRLGEMQVQRAVQTMPDAQHVGQIDLTFLARRVHENDERVPVAEGFDDDVRATHGARQGVGQEASDLAQGTLVVFPVGFEAGSFPLEQVDGQDPDAAATPQQRLRTGKVLPEVANVRRWTLLRHGASASAER